MQSRVSYTPIVHDLDIRAIHKDIFGYGSQQIASLKYEFVSASAINSGSYNRSDAFGTLDTCLR